MNKPIRIVLFVVFAVSLIINILQFRRILALERDWGKVCKRSAGGTDASSGRVQGARPRWRGDEYPIRFHAAADGTLCISTVVPLVSAQ